MKIIERNNTTLVVTTMTTGSERERKGIREREGGREKEITRNLKCVVSLWRTS